MHFSVFVFRTPRRTMQLLGHPAQLYYFVRERNVSHILVKETRQVC